MTKGGTFTVLWWRNGTVPLIECWHLLWSEINHALETSTAPLMICTLTSYTLLSSHVDTKWVLPTSTAHGFSSCPNDNNSGTWPPSVVPEDIEDTFWFQVGPPCFGNSHGLGSVCAYHLGLSSLSSVSSLAIVLRALHHLQCWHTAASDTTSLSQELVWQIQSPGAYSGLSLCLCEHFIPTLLTTS